MNTNHQLVCEDCYMEVLSPPKACDPWAVYSAKSMTDDKSPLTNLQKKIMAVLQETNGIELEALASILELHQRDLERELATLRHMELARGFKKGNQVYFTLFDDREEGA